MWENGLVFIYPCNKQLPHCGRHDCSRRCSNVKSIEDSKRWKAQKMYITTMLMVEEREMIWSEGEKKKVKGCGMMKLV